MHNVSGNIIGPYFILRYGIYSYFASFNFSKYGFAPPRSYLAKCVVYRTSFLNSCWFPKYNQILLPFCHIYTRILFFIDYQAGLRLITQFSWNVTLPRFFFSPAAHRKQSILVCSKSLILVDRPEGSIGISVQPASHLSLLT